MALQTFGAGIWGPWQPVQLLATPDILGDGVLCNLSITGSSEGIAMIHCQQLLWFKACSGEQLKVWLVYIELEYT